MKESFWMLFIDVAVISNHWIISSIPLDSDISAKTDWARSSKTRWLTQCIRWYALICIDKNSFVSHATSLSSFAFFYAKFNDNLPFTNPF